MSANPWGIASAVFGTLGGLSAQRDSVRAAKEQAKAIRDAAKLQADTQMAIAKPMLEASSYALPRIQSYANNLYGQMYQNNPLLTSQQRLNEQDIQRALAQANASTSIRYGANTSRARGESLRSAFAANDQLASTRLQYGLAQEQYKQNQQGQYANILQNLAGQGTVGSQLAYGATSGMAQGQIEAANVVGQAKQDMYSGLGYLSGQLTNWGLNKAFPSLLSSTPQAQQTALNQQNAKTKKPNDGSFSQGMNNLSASLGALGGQPALTTGIYGYSGYGLPQSSLSLRYRPFSGWSN